MRRSDCHPDEIYYARGLCKKCYSKSYELANREKRRIYRLTNRESRREKHSIYNRMHKEELQAYRDTHKEKTRVYNKTYYSTYKKELIAANTVYQRKKRREDQNYRIAGRLRSRLWHVIRDNQKVGSAVRDLGCSFGQFRLYIENQFEPGMTWDNYGEWHLDHVQPLASFDLTDRSQFLTACNWLNYQPLWAKENINKGAKWYNEKENKK